MKIIHKTVIVILLLPLPFEKLDTLAELHLVLERLDLGNVLAYLTDPLLVLDVLRRVVVDTFDHMEPAHDSLLRGPKNICETVGDCFGGIGNQN
ncbi:hypothetical protein BpHYR1_042155 [Brachionus plicatilis]|uniref:Uncharacterized protein n=1 Tax=Brachionus plicatilis TaxID=10195 RepID=A0A3M7QFS3_BRAPC|nr:hypothetical protein BpHYR1_042155 [Brachionus plicatilis]